MFPQGIRYVAYSYREEANFSRARYGYRLQPECHVWERAQAAFTFAFQDRLCQLARTRRRLYDDGTVFVLDLADARQSGRSADRTVGLDSRHPHPTTEACAAEACCGVREPHAHQYGAEAASPGGRATTPLAQAQSLPVPLWCLSAPVADAALPGVCRAAVRSPRLTPATAGEPSGWAARTSGQPEEALCRPGDKREKEGGATCRVI